MDLKWIYLFLCSLWMGLSCNSVSETEYLSSWTKPAMGTKFLLGSTLELQLQIPENAEPYDSIAYFIDTLQVASAKDTSAMRISTTNFPLGNRLITARIFRQGAVEERATHVILESGMRPEKFSYQVKHVFPHDTSSYVEGLEYYKNELYESAGEYGTSSLRRVDIKTGKILKKTPVRPALFAEGITIIGDKILQLTYKENLGMLYDLNTLQLIREFPCQNAREGWGLCSDGDRIYNTDGSNTVYFLNKYTFQQEGYIEVYDDKGPVPYLNELEYIDGKLYANIFMSDQIVIINPKNGQVAGEIDLAALYPIKKRNPNADVLNGIAWDAVGKRLFVTGKKWDKLFQIKLISSDIQDLVE